jgi:Ca2+-binding EF-hand superfamily protein
MHTTVYSPRGTTRLWPRPEGHKNKKLSFSPVITRDYAAPKQPARFAYQRTRSLRKLLIRSGASLDSEPCGHIPAGTRLLVLNEHENIGRVQIGSDFSDGLRPLGWVTRGKGADLFLRDFEEPNLPGTELNCSTLNFSPRRASSPRRSSACSPPTSVREQIDARLGMKQRVGTPPHAAGQEPPESMAARIARRRQARRQEREEAVPERPPEEQPLASKQARTQGAQGSSTAAADHPGVLLGGLLGSEELRRSAEEERQRAAANDARSFDTFASMVGRLILQSGKSVDRICDEWSRRSTAASKGGAINKFEFSVGIRKLLEAETSRSEKAHAAKGKSGARVSISGVGGGGTKEGGGQKERGDIEELFDSFDDDRSGELDLSELKAALKSLAKNVKAVEQMAQSNRERGAERVAVAEAFERAASEMEALEEASTELEKLRNPEVNGSLDVRLGAFIMQRNLKVGDLVAKWDSDGSGTIDAKEFKTHVKVTRFSCPMACPPPPPSSTPPPPSTPSTPSPQPTQALGLHAEAFEYAAVFRQMDGDGSGELDVAELRAALKDLQDAALKAAGLEKAQAKVLAEKRRAARESQAAANKARAEVDRATRGKQ